MVVLRTLLAVAIDAAGVGILAWLGVRTARFRERPSARPLTALLTTLALTGICSLGVSLPASVTTDMVHSLFRVGSLLGALLIPGIWVIYALSYTGRGPGLSRWRVAMLTVAVLPILAAAGTVTFGTLPTSAESLLKLLGILSVVYLFALFTYGMYLLATLAHRHGRVSPVQVLLLCIGVVAPFVLGGVGTDQTGRLSFGFLVSGGALAVASYRYPISTGFPKADHVARSRLIEALQEGVVVIDWNGYVIDANRAVTALFGDDSNAIVGEPLDSVVGDLADYDLSAGATGVVPLQTARGRRQFRYSVSAVGEQAGETAPPSNPVARAILLRDVTDRQTREQRLSVLNRVLRHNLRNELDIVLAHANRIDDETTQAAISDTSKELLALAEKARQAEDLMTAATEPSTSVDLSRVARTVVERFRCENRPADIHLRCPEELIVDAQEDVLREVLSELLENAVSHSDREVPQVDVRVGQSQDGNATLTIADDGPGIPAHEREILTEGVETQLRHGRGIGLWFVNWAVTKMGGNLTFRENDPRGSVVTVRLFEHRYEDTTPQS